MEPLERVLACFEEGPEVEDLSEEPVVREALQTSHLEGLRQVQESYEEHMHLVAEEQRVEEPVGSRPLPEDHAFEAEASSGALSSSRDALEVEKLCDQGQEGEGGNLQAVVVEAEKTPDPEGRNLGE